MSPNFTTGGISAAHSHSSSPAADAQFSKTPSAAITTTTGIPPCAQCDSDLEAYIGSTESGLMMHMGQKHGGQQLSQESVAQLRQLDWAAFVFCGTVRSRWGNRCNHCKTDTATQNMKVGHVFQNRRQLGHPVAATSWPFTHLTAASARRALWMTDHFRQRETRACALTARGSLSKSMKGLVGGAAQGPADCRKNWTTALIPRSSGFGTHSPVRSALRQHVLHGEEAGTKQREVQ